MKRAIAPILAFLLVALAGCASTPNAATATPAQTDVASAAVDATPPTASDTTLPSETTTTPTEEPPSVPPAGGTATDFCGAFAELAALNESLSGDPASLGARLQAAAADMRRFAPAEIATAANTYADVLDAIGKAATNGTYDEAAFSKAIAEGMAGNAKDIGTTAAWVGKNCNL